MKIYTDIIKSQKDSSTYRGLELANGMRVLLISDPTTEQSAAAVCVRVGFLSDPPDLPGLAHFCEHMLYLGTEKYPAENEYKKFLQQHGGRSNAFTQGDNTCYFFDVLPNFLRQALDIFAQFFLSPLFTESATEREVNSIHSEFEKNLKIDPWRFVWLERATCNPAHDFNKFGPGNIETLWNIPKSKGISIREELFKFHEKYYSSNIMALVVLGKESIEELTDFVVPLFSNVSNKNVEIPEWKEHPFDASRLKQQVFVVPVKEVRSLHISFPVPDLHHLYRSNPGLYLSHLIGHAGPGSLLSELKNYGLVSRLTPFYKIEAKGFAFFNVYFDLTDEGVDHVNDIVTHFFQYLTMLKEAGPQKWIFEEWKNLASLAFLFKDTEDSLSYCCTLAGLMSHYPMKEILSGPYLLYDYEPDHISNLLNMLTPQNIRITIIGKKNDNICTETEKWCGIRYKIQPIPVNILNTWKNAKPHHKFKLPSPNEFIPTSLEFVPRERDNPKYPQLIKNTVMGRLWFKQDDAFLLPKAVLKFELESPVLFQDPLHVNMSHLFVELVKDSLNECAYAAGLVGLSYNLKITELGIYLNIKGYNDKLHVLLRIIMDRLTTFKIDGKRFNILKEELHRILKNFHAEEPQRHATYFRSLLLLGRGWTNEELLHCIEEVTLEDVEQMIPRLLSKVHIESLIHGNLTKKQALSLMNIVEYALVKNMRTKCLMPSQLKRDREVKLSDGHQYIYEASNYVHSSSAVEVYYQCGIQETRSNILLELLNDLMTEPSFNFLRTQEQLGYFISTTVLRSRNCAQGIRILVQSDKPPSYVDGRIEAFLQYFDRYIKDMSGEEFQNHVQSLANARLVQPHQLHVQADKYWKEIAAREYNFDRDNIEVAALRTITKEELYSYFKELVAQNAPKRKKLSVHVKSSSCKSDNDVLGDGPPDAKFDLVPPLTASRPPQKIYDVVSFKHSLGLYPLVPASLCIPSPPYVNRISQTYALNMSKGTKMIQNFKIIQNGHRI